MLKLDAVEKKLAEKKRELRYLNERIDEIWDAPSTALVVGERIKYAQRIMRTWGAIEGMMRVAYDGEDYMLEINKIDKELRETYRKPIISNTEVLPIELDKIK